MAKCKSCGEKVKLLQSRCETCEVTWQAERERQRIEAAEKKHAEELAAAAQKAVEARAKEESDYQVHL